MAFHQQTSKYLIHDRDSACLSEMLIDPWIDKGSTLVQLGKFQEGINCFDKAVDIGSMNYRSRCNKGVAPMFQDEFDETIISR
jgi:hypothetical protein